MKMTIVTDKSGQVVGAVQGHSLTEKHGDVEVRVAFAPSAQLHYVDVDDDLSNITDAAVFQSRLVQHVPKA